MLLEEIFEGNAEGLTSADWFLSDIIPFQEVIDGHLPGTIFAGIFKLVPEFLKEWQKQVLINELKLEKPKKSTKSYVSRWKDAKDSIYKFMTSTERNRELLLSAILEISMSHDRYEGLYNAYKKRFDDVDSSDRTGSTSLIGFGKALGLGVASSMLAQEFIHLLPFVDK